jgi:uncharacterized protein
MISIDTNLLLYSLNPASAWHSKAVMFLQEQLGNPAMQVVLTDYVLVELYVLLRNPAVMSKPLSARAARDLVTAYWDIPTIMRVEHAHVMDEVWKLAGVEDFARRRVFDARLALTLRRAGVTHFTTSNVKDFEGWGFQKVWNPLL